MHTGPRLDGNEPMNTIFKRTTDGLLMGLKTVLINYQVKWLRVKKNMRAKMTIQDISH